MIGHIGGAKVIKYIRINKFGTLIQTGQFRLEPPAVPVFTAEGGNSS
ncbi:MAG: hypothetical protein V1857_05950 [archaeon]